MLEGKRISVVVPKKEIQRVKKIIKNGPRTVPKTVWLIDFRGIRSNNVANKSKKKRKFAGEKASFNSPEKLQDLVNQYFESCYSFMYDKEGNIKYDRYGEPIRYQARPFTVSGLAYAIGVSTATLNRYCSGIFDAECDDDSDVGSYKSILVRAKQKIESYAEARLYDKEGSFGAKFVLDSSFGWCTQREQSEMREREFNMWLREQEFKLKKELTAMGEEDSGVEIRIVRKSVE